MKANKGVSNEKIKIIPLGGLEHIGMNIYLNGEIVLESSCEISG